MGVNTVNCVVYSVVTRYIPYSGIVFKYIFALTGAKGCVVKCAKSEVSAVLVLRNQIFRIFFTLISRVTDCRCFE